MGHGLSSMTCNERQLYVMYWMVHRQWSDAWERIVASSAAAANARRRRWHLTGGGRHQQHQPPSRSRSASPASDEEHDQRRNNGSSQQEPIPSTTVKDNLHGSDYQQMQDEFRNEARLGCDRSESGFIPSAG
jgi:hypothetical protein